MALKGNVDVLLWETKEHWGCRSKLLPQENEDPQNKKRNYDKKIFWLMVPKVLFYMSTLISKKFC